MRHGAMLKRHDDLGPVTDLDLRLVRYFTVLAEELNFGRAAQRLFLTQPTLSRQVRRLEVQLGTPLLERDAQGSRLTPGGEAFLADARQLLALAERTTRRARTGLQAERLTVGYVDDLVVTDLIRALRETHPAVAVTARHVLPLEGGDALRRHDIDALVARSPMPFATSGLDMTVLYDEARILAVGAGHALANAAAVTPDDFAAEPLATCATKGSPDWAAFWRFDLPGAPPTSRRMSEADNVHDLLELVAGDDAVAVFPAHDRRVGLRDDIVTIPIAGAKPCHVVVVRRAGDDRDLVTAVATHAAKRLRPTERASLPGAV
jgi:DNA-binding transcriptional LysR family regulator